MAAQHGVVDFAEERLEMFPTRFFRRKYTGLDGFNRRMREIILAKERADAGGVVRSNVGGWHSESDLLKWPEPEIGVLLELFQSSIGQAVGVELQRDPATFDMVASMEAWANVTRTGGYNRPHMHPLTNFALVYYVDAGDVADPDSVEGCIEFLDPRSRVATMKTPGVDARDSVRMRPSSSTMLLFPAWIYHYVHPYQGTTPRISIACNVTIREVNDKRADAGERPSAVIIEG